MTIASQILETNMQTSTLADRDVASGISHIGEPSEATLVTLCGGMSYIKGENKPQKVAGKVPRKSATQRKIEVLERSPLSRSFTVASAVSDTTTTTVVLSSNSGLRANDTIVNSSVAFGEYMLITAVDAGGANITVRRNIGSTSYTIAAGDILKVVGSAHAESTEKPSVKTQLIENRTRYLQINKRGFRISNTALAIDVIANDVNMATEEQYVSLVEFKKDINASAWFNPYNSTTTDASGNTVYLAAGILSEIRNFATETRYLEYDSITLETLFGVAGENIFKYGNQRKALICSSRFKSMLGSLLTDKMIVNQGEDKFGFNVTTIDINHGILDIYLDATLNTYLPDSANGTACILDLPYLEYRYLKDRDMMMMDNIQTPGGDYKESAYIAEFGWLLKNVQHHYLIYPKA